MHLNATLIRKRWITINKRSCAANDGISEWHPAISVIDIHVVIGKYSQSLWYVNRRMASAKCYMHGQ